MRFCFLKSKYRRVYTIKTTYNYLSRVRPHFKLHPQVRFLKTEALRAPHLFWSPEDAIYVHHMSKLTQLSRREVRLKCNRAQTTSPVTCLPAIPRSCLFLSFLRSVLSLFFFSAVCRCRGRERDKRPRVSPPNTYFIQKGRRKENPFLGSAFNPTPSRALAHRLAGEITQVLAFRSSAIFLPHALYPPFRPGSSRAASPRLLPARPRSSL